MPGIFIGIGGIGGSIVAQVRQALNVHVAFAGDSPAAHTAAGQFRFLLIDTWKDSVALGFDSSEVFDFPTGLEKFGVDDTIENWYHGGDPTFHQWWPERNRAPLKVGDFSSGAGQLRIKGKLGYRIGLTGSSKQAAPAVQAALHAIDAVRGPATGVRTVPVYLVCSLGGGTGSGMVLTFAQHLRQVLPNYCNLIGVFPMAGVTHLGPGAADRSSIWANTDAALREIDYCQRVAGTPDNQLTPFFQWPGDGHVLYGKQRPFEYIYLFGRENRSGQALETFSEYIDLISETLVAESFSNLIDEGLPDGIRGPHSQFTQQMIARPEVGGQATTYASAAIGALVYPGERIERHLARRYAIAVLDRLIRVDRARVDTALDDFMVAEKLDWSGTHSLRIRLHDQVENRATARLNPLPTFPRRPSMDKDEPFQQAKQGKAAAIVRQAKADLDTFAPGPYAQHLRQRRDVVVDEFAAKDGGIRKLVHTLLAEGGPGALGVAYTVVSEVRDRLRQQYQQLNELIQGDQNATVPVAGLKQSLSEMDDRWSGAVNRLNNGFGNGLTRAFNQNGKAAKEQFLRQTWTPYYRDSLALQDMVAARATYQELLADTDRVQQALGDLIGQIEYIRDNLARSAATSIGKHGKVGVLDLAIMDDPRLVAHHFDAMLSQAISQNAENCAIRVTTVLTPSEEEDGAAGDDAGPASDEDQPAAEKSGIIERTFAVKANTRGGGAGLLHDQFRDDLEATLVTDGLRHLSRRVLDLSVWEALAAECRARLELELADQALTSAVRRVDDERRQAEQAGAPPKDRETEVLRYFIRNKLVQCQTMVRPFWNLNNQMISTHGQPYHFTVIAADRGTYREAGAKFRIDGVLEATAAEMQAGTPKWLPGRDRIVLYTREGVAPLFYINDRELKDLRDAAAQKRKEKFLYTDLRFARELDPVIRPREEIEDTYRYAIALALQLQLVTRQSPNGHGPDPSALRLADGTEFPNVVALDAALRENPAAGAAFLDQVNEGMTRIDLNQRDTELQQAMNRVRTMNQHATDQDRPAEMRWWQRAEQVLYTRMNYGQHFISV